MMEEYLPYILTFLSAFAITYFHVYSSQKFHNYFFLIDSSFILLLNCFIYGLLAIGLFVILKDKVITISDDKTKIGNYLYPVAVGISIKGIADLNLFNIKTNGFLLPIGIKTFTQPLDTFFEEKLDGLCFEKSKKFLDPYLIKYRQVLISDYSNDIALLKQDMTVKLNTFHPDSKKTAAFVISEVFAKAKTSDDLLVLILREFGSKIFSSIFPK